MNTSETVAKTFTKIKRVIDEYERQLMSKQELAEALVLDEDVRVFQSENFHTVRRRSFWRRVYLISQKSSWFTSWQKQHCNANSNRDTNQNRTWNYWGVKDRFTEVWKVFGSRCKVVEKRSGFAEERFVRKAANLNTTNLNNCPPHKSFNVRKHFFIIINQKNSRTWNLLENQGFADVITENYHELALLLNNTMQYGVERLENYTSNETKLAVATLLNSGKLDNETIAETHQILTNVKP